MGALRVQNAEILPRSMESQVNLWNRRIVANAVQEWMVKTMPEHIDVKKVIEDLEKTINHKLGEKEIGIVNAFAYIFEALAEKANEEGEK